MSDVKIFTKEMKNSIFTMVRVIMVFLCLAAVCRCTGHVSDAKETESAADYLVKTGMSLQEIEVMDSDVRRFIADDLRCADNLKNTDEPGWIIDRNIPTLTKTGSEQNTAAFYINVYAFRAGMEYRIYAVYESFTGIMPDGNDSLFLGVGDGLAAREYGGRIWYKKAGDEAWTQGGGLAANHRTQRGGTFTGGQLGDFRRKMLVKGCVYCHAGEGAGNDTMVTVEYTHRPSKGGGETWLYLLIVTVTVVVVLILRKRE